MTKKSSNWEKQSGFTLIEVITVLTLISVMLVAATPALLDWLPNIRFRQITRDFYSDLQTAKMDAVKRNINVGVSLTSVACPPLGDPVPIPGGSYTMFRDDGSGAGGVANDGVQNGSESTIREGDFPEKVAFCANTIGASFRYLPTGQPTTPGNLTIHNDNGRANTISCTIAGGITVN